MYSTEGSALFSAPLLILHYGKRHGYTPPSNFQEALASVDEPLGWDSRAETLSLRQLEEAGRRAGVAGSRGAHAGGVRLFEE
ncbi:DUF7919 family protein [Streptomyces sp. NPDC002092]